MARVSVIIPLHRYNDIARRCVETTLAVAGDDHAVIVVSDQPVDGLPPGVRVVHTGSPTDTSPAEKRDAALAQVDTEFCAFLDDDAWPREDWFERALARFDSDPSVAAVGGPGLTPPDSGFRERAGGAFYESPFGSAGMRNRFVQVGELTETDDWPAFNFLARTDVLRSIGGWASKFYGGEDTKLCLMLVEAGHRIVADPNVVVFHARRAIFRDHMRQVGNVGRHRGWFVHKYPRTSARPVYFAPALALVLGPLVAAWCLCGPSRRRRRALAAGVLGWTAISADAVRRGTDVDAAFVLPAVLAASHGAYGAGFIEGLLFTDEIDAM